MSTRSHHGRAWADVSLANLVANARTVLAQAPGARLLPMVKADAYGLGAVSCARALATLEPWGFGVATLAEAAELRQARMGDPVLVFTPGDLTDLRDYQDLDCRAVLDRADVVRGWEGPFHLEVDTGMSRCGVRWDDVEGLAACRSPHLEGAFTHLYSADDAESPSVRRQLDRFAQAVVTLGERPGFLHVANSAGVWRPTTGFDLVRPGIYLYGGRAAADLPAPRPVLSLRAPVVSVRNLHTGDTVSYGGEWTASHDTRIATLGVGYADGVPRALRGNGQVLIGGHRYPIVGRVTMDFVMVDVGPHGPAVVVGDVATLIGADGSDAITVDEFATWAGTVSYEILARLGARVPRIQRDT